MYLANQTHSKRDCALSSLPSDLAVYLLSGQLPLVADLQRRVLGSMGIVLRSNSIEREIAQCQILLKDNKSKS